MPIYEFYCLDCHMIFNFFSPAVNTSKRPFCPKCGRPDLERLVSVFSISKGLKDTAEEDQADIDDSRLEQAMQLMADQADKIDPDDPKQAANLMKDLFAKAGLQMGPGMEEAMHRMESGEDPEQIEADLGDALDGEDLISAVKRAVQRKKGPPKQDEAIYDL